MDLLALDVSTKPGWAFFKDKKLVRYGTMFADKEAKDFPFPYPFNFICLAEHITGRLCREILDPCLIECGNLKVIIEETNPGRNVYSQKKLEFIHYSLIKMLDVRKVCPIYIRDGSWKNAVGARQNAEEKKRNAQISRYKKKNDSKLAKLDLDGSGKLKVVGKLSDKHYAIRAFKEHFGIQLKREEEDAADAALIGLGYMLGVPICNGTDNDTHTKEYLERMQAKGSK